MFFKKNKEKQENQNQESFVKVLGGGCANCNMLTVHTQKALFELNQDMSIQKVSEYKDIASYGVMQTPALVLGSKVVIQGKVASVDEIKEKIQEELKI